MGAKIGVITTGVVVAGAAVAVPIIIISSNSASDQTTEVGNKTNGNTPSKSPQNNSSSSTKDPTDNTEDAQGDNSSTSGTNTTQNNNTTSGAGSNSTSSNNNQQSQSGGTSSNTSNTSTKPNGNSSNTSKPSTPTTNPSTSTKYNCSYLNEYAANHNGRVPEGYDREEYMRTCLSAEEYNERKFWETHQAFYGDGTYTDIEVAAMVLWTNQHCTYSNGQQSCNAHQPWLLPANITYFNNIAAQYCEFRGMQEAAGEPYNCQNAPDWVQSLETQTRDYAAQQNGGIYYTQAHFSVPLLPTGTNSYTIYTTKPSVPTSIYPTNCTRQTVYEQSNVLVCPFKGSY